MKKGIVIVLSVIVGVILGVFGVGYVLSKENTLQSKKVDKYKGYYNLLNQWLILKNEKKEVKQYFINNNYNTIAIYGMGEMGCRLIEELENSDIEIKYTIDKKSGGLYANVEVLDMDDDLEEVDVVVVTATFAFDDILCELEKKLNCPIISLEDLLYEV